ncbi:U1 small nuclear ribonucleoprotein [Zymoseptoria brevis]|uniref:U1 small nuclear ribonucleoprotein n=1 Tax=Zymoseptoria brevis TaxID=1047168 RepID=A0A0F4GBD3_9PEZI|nr:U1 small nuclear ribonucleoprotein [Zymoseptoria brevis]
MAEPNPPNATLYLRNLPERQVSIPLLKEGIREIVEDLGTVLDIRAGKSLKQRGQAFVVYSSVEEATEAHDILQDIELFGRKIQVQYARARSDATVQKDDGEEALAEHKKVRLAEKARKQALEEAKPVKRAAERDSIAERPAKSNKAATAVADDYLPPNRILLLRDFPEGYGKTELTALFQRYPGFKEIRMVPGRAGLAFAEYEEETQSAAAREALNGMSMGESKFKVTFQKKQ